MKFGLFLVLILCSSAFASETFFIKNASRNIDLKIEVEKCHEGFCEGQVEFSFYRKKTKKPFQIIKLPDTELWLDKNRNAQVNITLRYDEQSAANFDDFNFDGSIDVALCDGKNGGYGMPSYRIYLYSKKSNRFVFSSSFTKISQDGSLGMFEVDREKKILYRYSKSGCCWHQTEGFSVAKNRPKKIYELTDEVTMSGERLITTKKFLRGKWRTWKKKR